MFVRKKTFLFKIDSRHPDRRAICKAARVFKEGKIIAFPTETVYAIGGKRHSSAIEKRLHEIMEHSPKASLSYCIGDWLMLESLKIKKKPMIASMVRQFWPGPVIFIVSDLAGRQIRIQFPRNKIALALIQEIKEPMIMVDEVLSGHSSPRTASEISEMFHNRFDCLIDGGRTELRQSATIVDLTGEMPVMLHKGAQGSEVEKVALEIQSGKCPKKRILVVCTGNICRSPMAVEWLKCWIEQKGLSSEIEVMSCGTHAHDGVPCTPETEILMKERGIDLKHFRSRLCRGGDLWSSDLIFAMSPQHARAMGKLLPSVKGKTIILDVDDPAGKGLDFHQKAIWDIEKKLKHHETTIFRLGQS